MKWFIEYFFPSVAKAFYGEGYQKAIKDILVFKDKIYTGPVTLSGTQKSITNCTFFGGTFLGGECDTKITQTPTHKP